MLSDKILEVIHNHYIEYADIMIYFYDQVILGKYSDSQLFIPLNYDEELFNEIHIFNDDLEIRWSLDNDIVIIKDTDDYLEEKMFLIGNKSEVQDGYSIISQYGRKFVLPYEISFHSVKDNHLRLVVHHLISNGTISGYRLVKISGVSDHGNK